MAAPEVHHLFHHPIADHSFSADRNTLAVARESNVELYSRSGGKFVLKDELKGHDKTVTSVDIAPKSGRIVTCSQGIFLHLLSSHICILIISFYRSECSRMGTLPYGMETYSSPVTY